MNFSSNGAPDVARSGALQLNLLGGFTLVHRHEAVRPGAGGRRLLAFLALHDGPMARGRVAGTLWWDRPAAQAASNLRAALFRLPRPGGRPLVTADIAQLRLADHVTVDLAVARREIEELRASAPPDPASGDRSRLLTADLLPAWDEDWVLLERERHRQLRLHALERLAGALCRAGRYEEALAAGLAAVAGEPLRESSHRRVIEIHLAEGNAGEALRQFETYRRLVRDELGIAPSPAIRGLVQGLLGRPVDDAAGPAGPAGSAAPAGPVPRGGRRSRREPLPGLYRSRYGT